MHPLPFQFNESQVSAANNRSRCLEQGISYYRYNPHLSEDISPGETDREKLVKMIVDARSYMNDSRDFSDMILRFHELARVNYKVYQCCSSVE